MATRNLNRILATVMISSTAVSLTPMPTFANITHPAACSESMNFDGHQKIQPMCYSAYSNTRYDRAQKANQAQDLDNSENRSSWKWPFSSECSSIPPSKSFLDSSKSIPACGKLPIDDKGEVEKEVYKIYEKIDGNESPDVIYKDIQAGTGHTVTDSDRSKVSIHYDKYDKFKESIRTNRPKSSSSSEPILRKPKVISFCKDYKHFGEGFKIGMRGMRTGGIRRIIILHENGKNPEVFDVELLQVCPSKGCWIINRLI